MINAFSIAFGQLSDKSFRRVIWVGLIGSCIIFAILWSAIGTALFSTQLYFTGWLWGLFDWVGEWLTDIFGGLAVVFLTWLLFPSVVTLIVSFFLEDAIKAVESRHYPELADTRRQSVKEIVLITVKFTLISLVLNILALPIYVIFFFIGPLNLFVFYALNGYLLGREYFELVAHRRYDPLQAIHLRSTFKGQMFLAGVVIAFLMTIPVVNLVAPMVATAALVHLVHTWQSRLDVLANR